MFGPVGTSFGSHSITAKSAWRSLASGFSQRDEVLTSVHRLGWSLFLPGKLYLENYDIS
jgi:hypothetical protein